LNRDSGSIELLATAAGVEFAVKVVPGASRDRIAGPLGGALKVAVAAPPEGGRANAAVIELLAAHLGAKRSEVEIVGGRNRPQKRIRVRGVPIDAIRARLTSVR
jgi:hypothetical protein